MMQRGLRAKYVKCVAAGVGGGNRAGLGFLCGGGKQCGGAPDSNGKGEGHAAELRTRKKAPELAADVS